MGWTVEYSGARDGAPFAWTSHHGDTADSAGFAFNSAIAAQSMAIHLGATVRIRLCRDGEELENLDVTAGVARPAAEGARPL